MRAMTFLGLWVLLASGSSSILTGFGHTPPQAESVFQAVRTLAERGNAKTQHLPRLLFEQGKGATQDHAEPTGWRWRVLEEGQSGAAFRLGFIYGRTGRTKQTNGLRLIDSEARIEPYSAQLTQGSGPGLGSGGQQQPPYFMPPELAYRFALSLEEGVKVAQDYREAARLYRVAAERGHTDAQFRLGVMYSEGRGVPQDYTEAARWFRAAAERGHAEAQYHMGQLYLEGKGVPQDLAEAALWLGTAAEHGHAEAQFRMGQLYLEGKGVPQDFAESVRWYQRAAESGSAHGQLELARLYRDGRGVPRDEKEAFRWFRQADQQGVPADLKDRLSWYRQFAKAGEPVAARTVAEIFHYGQGVAQDLPEAARWYGAAALQGDAAAQYMLGRLYAEGQGVRRDLTEAARWYRKAAEQGDADAQFALSLMYLEGRGVPKDLVEAHAWANLAASRLGGPARELRDKIAAQVNPAQLDEAQKRATVLASQIPMKSQAGNAADGPRPFEQAQPAGGQLIPPTLIYKVEPEFTDEARQAKVSGTVLVSLEVNPLGMPQNPRVIKGIGYGLDERAIEAVMKWRFRPGVRDGRRVTVGATVEVKFETLAK